MEDQNLKFITEEIKTLILLGGTPCLIGTVGLFLFPDHLEGVTIISFIAILISIGLLLKRISAKI